MCKQKRVKRSRQQKPGIPEGSVYVGRPSQWGNPAKIGDWYRASGKDPIFVKDNRMAVAEFYEYGKQRCEADPVEFARWLYPLLNRDVCCWCSLDLPCHGDVLIYFLSLIKVDQFFNTYSIYPPKTWPPLSEIVGNKLV